MSYFDVTIVGAGAAGLFCAGVAGQLGLRVLLIDHAPKVAEKIRISGGGRCNFTNRDLDPRAPHKHFLSQNPHFCRSALSRYTPADFMALLQRHGVPFHEKHKGQLFCDRSAQDLIDVLLRECEAGGVQRWQPCAVQSVAYHEAASDNPARYTLHTHRGVVTCRSLVVATGGLSIPKIGATDFGFKLARQFGLKVVEPRPALVPLTFDGNAWAPFADLAGLAMPVAISTGEKKQRTTFHEDLLFPHRGLSGGCPAASSARGQSTLAQAAAQRTGAPAAQPAGPHLDASPTRVATSHQRNPRQSPDPAGRQPAPLGPHPHRHRGLRQSRSHRGRGGHAATLVPDAGSQDPAWPALHWRGGGRDRLAGRLQLSVGVGQRGGVCAGIALGLSGVIIAGFAGNPRRPILVRDGETAAQGFKARSPQNPLPAPFLENIS